MGGVGEGWVKRVERLRSKNCQLQKQPEDVKYSIGNVANNIVITMNDVRPIGIITL